MRDLFFHEIVPFDVFTSPCADRSIGGVMTLVRRSFLCNFDFPQSQPLVDGRVLRALVAEGWSRGGLVTYITLVSPSTSLQICRMFLHKTLAQPWRYLTGSQFWRVGTSTSSTSSPMGNPHWYLMPLPLCSHQVIVCLSAFCCEGNWSALLKYSSACPHISPLRIQPSPGLTGSTQPPPLGNWSC